jgi:hypothetical protein
MVEYGVAGALFSCDQIDARSFGKFVRVGLGYISIKSHCPICLPILPKHLSPDRTKLIHKSGIIAASMTMLTLPVVMKDTILHDAIRRDVTTARRVALLEILWNERYLTRSQLIARVELRLGKKCFGISAWEDTFYRDIRFVKQAFEAAGYRLLYSRKKEQPGYYLDGQPALSSEIKQVLMGSLAEVDERQIDIYRRLSFAERFYQGCSISDTARKVVAYRIHQENPRLSLLEANRMTLQRAYSQ